MIAASRFGREQLAAGLAAAAAKKAAASSKLNPANTPVAQGADQRRGERSR